MKHRESLASNASSNIYAPSKNTREYQIFCRPFRGLSLKIADHINLQNLIISVHIYDLHDEDLHVLAAQLNDPTCGHQPYSHLQYSAT